MSVAHNRQTKVPYVYLQKKASCVAWCWYFVYDHPGYFHSLLFHTILCPFFFLLLFKTYSFLNMIFLGFGGYPLIIYQTPLLMCLLFVCIWCACIVYLCTVSVFPLVLRLWFNTFTIAYNLSLFSLKNSISNYFTRKTLQFIVIQFVLIQQQ